MSVSDMKGKFIKPTLKKVSKYENKFAKLQKKAAEFNFRNQLKTVKKKEFTMDEEEHGVIENCTVTLASGFIMLKSYSELYILQNTIVRTTYFKPGFQVLKVN